jgi:hypothetical protein
MPKDHFDKSKKSSFKSFKEIYLEMALVVGVIIAQKNQETNVFDTIKKNKMKKTKRTKHNQNKPFFMPIDHF